MVSPTIVLKITHSLHTAPSLCPRPDLLPQSPHSTPSTLSSLPAAAPSSGWIPAQLLGAPEAFIQRPGGTWHPSWVNTSRGHPSATGEGQEGQGRQRGQGRCGPRPVPGPQLILAAPDEVPELLVVGVVVVLDSEEHGSRDLHQRVVGCLLLLPAGVAVVEVVDLVSYLWKEPRGQDFMNMERRGMSRALGRRRWCLGQLQVPWGLPAAPFGNLESILQCLRYCGECPTHMRQPQKLQQNSMGEWEKERMRAASRGSLIPIRADKVFPCSPKQQQMHSCDV